MLQEHRLLCRTVLRGCHWVGLTAVQPLLMLQHSLQPRELLHLGAVCRAAAQALSQVQGLVLHLYPLQHNSKGSQAWVQL